MTNEIMIVGALTVGFVLFAFLSLLRPTINPIRFVMRVVRLGIMAVVLATFWFHALTHL